MFGKIVLVFAILAVTSTSWIEASLTDNEDSFSVDPIPGNPPECGINEYLSKDDAFCQPTCENPKITACVRIPMSGCVCKKGYIRRSSQSECIKRKNCYSLK